MTYVISGKVFPPGNEPTFDINIEVTDPEVIKKFDKGVLNYFSIFEDSKLVKDEDL